MTYMYVSHEITLLISTEKPHFHVTSIKVLKDILELCYIEYTFLKASLNLELLNTYLNMFFNIDFFS